MPDPQPGQMGDPRITREELVSIIADAVDELKPFSPELDEADISESLYRRMTAAITRPAAGFGDDGALIARLRAVDFSSDELGGDIGTCSYRNPDGPEAADRLILYGEAREVLANRIAAAIQQARDEIGATEQQRLAFAYAEAAMRAALTHARQEGDK